MNCPKCGMMMSFDGNKYECELCGYTQGGIKMGNWKAMEKRIKEQAKHAKEYWGFECLKNATKLVWDIGQEVYFVIGDEVRKGIVCLVYPSGMCGLRIIPESKVVTIFYKRSIELYTNVYYALKQAEYQAMELKKK